MATPPHAFYYDNPRFNWVDVEITNHCNFSCWFCPREAMTRPLGHMGYEQFTTIADKIDHADIVSELLIGGIGEPTLHKDLCHMLAYLKQRTSLQATLINNGSRLSDPDFREALLDSGVDRVIISLRLSDPVKQAASLPKRFDHQAYLDGLAEFVRLRQSRKASTAIEIAFLKETYYSKYVLGLHGGDFVNAPLLDDFTARLAAITGEALPSYSELTAPVRSRLSNVENVRVGDGLVFRLDGPSCWTTAHAKFVEDRCKPARFGSCLGMLEHFAIYWNGDVSTCCADFDVKNRLGNLLEDNTLKDILNNSRARFFAANLARKRMPSATCRACRGGVTHLEKWANMIGTILYTS